MYTTLFIPLLAKEIEIPAEDSHQAFEAGDLVRVKISDEQEDCGYFRSIRTTPLNSKEVLTDAKIIDECTETDKKIMLENEDFCTQQKELIQKEIQQLKLPMSIVDIYLPIDKKTLLISFTSDSRVDFRDLVRILAGKYKKKITLYQIGSRDSAKQIGGYGICGRKICCSNHLAILPSVTMDSAREQNIAFKGTESLSGLCGKLKCCLNFEAEQYKKLKKQFPSFGDKIKINGEKYAVIGMDILNGKIKLRGEENYITIDLQTYQENSEKAAKDPSSKTKGTEQPSATSK